MQLCKDCGWFLAVENDGYCTFREPKEDKLISWVTGEDITDYPVCSLKRDSPKCRDYTQIRSRL